VRGLRVVREPRRLAVEEREVEDAAGVRIRLSDHAPVLAEFVR
jgi:endonuclease/exonuclease/phosphatase (EEP) superfamily protein YafD